MRHIGSLEDEQSAERFGAFLKTQSIRASIDPEGDWWAVWIHSEDLIEVARDALVQFKADPDAACFADAVVAAGRLRKAEAKKAKQTSKKSVNVRDRWDRPLASRCPVTFGLIALSILVFLLTKDWAAVNLGGSMWRFADQEFPLLDKLWIASRFNDVGQWIWSPQTGLRQIEHGQIWRLMTPVFIHMNPIHILFNMLWIQRLGVIIEFRNGSVRFAVLVLMIAVFSNVGQYLVSGPSFGGMSGVLYGLFGYLWMKSRYDPGSGFTVDANMVMWLMIWLVVCMTGSVGPVANTAHTAGLITGGLIAMAPVWWRKLT
jgi:GlpG protein